jgi:glycerate dehydrogenase
VQKASVVVTLSMPPEHLARARHQLEGVASVVELNSLDEGARAQALSGADALLCRHTGKELRPGEAALVTRARVVQFINAGLDFIPLHEFTTGVPIASNNGAYAQPIAEHGMAMYLAASKRLLIEHDAMRRGEFNQNAMNQSIAGKTCGILGLGGIGTAIARLARAFGMTVFAVNRRGHADEPVDRMGTLSDLDALLAESDVLMVCTPLTPKTRGLLGARELQLMKPDATLVNLARGEIIDETALYRRLREHPQFTACIEGWWVEPTRHDRFALQHPFFELPNFIGSPHNSATVPSAFAEALARAVANIRHVLLGGTPRNLVPAEERAAASRA